MPSGILLVHPLPASATSLPWPLGVNLYCQDLILTLGSATGNGPSVGSASVPGPAEWVWGPHDRLQQQKSLAPTQPLPSLAQ